MDSSRHGNQRCLQPNSCSLNGRVLFFVGASRRGWSWAPAVCLAPPLRRSLVHQSLQLFQLLELIGDDGDSNEASVQEPQQVLHPPPSPPPTPGATETPFEV
ncbi:uncharacterized protein V6R79_014405 [Siganus canaliculatus]